MHTSGDGVSRFWISRVTAPPHRARPHAIVRILFGAGLLAAACTLAGCQTDADAIKAATTEQPTMSLAAAKRTIQRWARWFGNDGAVDHNQYSVNFEPTRWGATDYVPAANKKTTALLCEYEKYQPRIIKVESASYGPNKGRNAWQVGPVPAEGCASPGIQVPTEAAAKEVMAAFQRWKMSTQEERDAFFAQEARAAGATLEVSARTRTAPAAIPEEVRRHRVIADAAIREKRFVDAANAYEDALEIAPGWAQGHFNAALVLAEIYYYRDAVNHMKKYLALAPGARDAREVQDKIYEWEDVLRIKS
jgi:tetratricopeptide (TPR) repeat protein